MGSSCRPSLHLTCCTHCLPPGPLRLARPGGEGSAPRTSLTPRGDGGPWGHDPPGPTVPSPADITVICPWEAFNHLELHELAQYGII